MLNGVLKQVQRNLDPQKVLRKDFETYMKDLDRVSNGIKSLMRNSRYGSEVELFLNSADAVIEEISEAEGHLWAALIPIDVIHSSTASIARQMESARELKKAIGKSADSLKRAIKRFRI